jgi:2,3-diketo-5-methylthio-1-phosphopentane phosphatase/methylthioribulose-1-phosphate dehydratase
MIRAIVVDIEGTTSALSVLKDVLAPYARQQLAPYVRHVRTLEVEQALAATRQLAAEPDADRERAIAILERWIDEDRKAPPLKLLQGLLWERGFRDGSLRAHVYPDVAPALHAWRDAGYALYVYSSGSVLAQKSFFGHTIEGDLRGCFRGWFDTQVGAKQEPASYAAIARAIALEPAEVLFLSDANAELVAARKAGLSAVGLARAGNAPIDGPQVRSFAELDVSPIASLVALTKYCHGRGWLEATSGNLSVRLANELAITASGRDKGALSVADVAFVDEHARAREGKPSAEAPLHASLYRARPQVRAIAHTHSLASTVLSRRYAEAGAITFAGFEMAKAIRDVTTHEIALTLPVIANAQDMAALEAAASSALARHPAAPAYLVAGHGLTTWAEDLPTLKRQLEALEFLLSCRLHED